MLTEKLYAERFSSAERMVANAGTYGPEDAKRPPNPYNNLAKACCCIIICIVLPILIYIYIIEIKAQWLRLFSA